MEYYGITALDAKGLKTMANMFILMNLCIIYTWPLQSMHKKNNFQTHTIRNTVHKIFKNVNTIQFNAAPHILYFNTESWGHDIIQRGGAGTTAFRGVEQMGKDMDKLIKYKYKILNGLTDNILNDKSDTFGGFIFKGAKDTGSFKSCSQLYNDLLLMMEQKSESILRVANEA
eukprot:152144_1